MSPDIDELDETLVFAVNEEPVQQCIQATVAIDDRLESVEVLVSIFAINSVYDGTEENGVIGDNVIVNSDASGKT